MVERGGGLSACMLVYSKKSSHLNLLRITDNAVCLHEHDCSVPRRTIG